MTEDSQPTSQATNNELAAFYLQDRDIPCPSCNYNRRDGTTETCPECGTPLQLTTVGSQQHLRHNKLIKLVLLFLWISAIAGIIGLIYLTIDILRLIEITQNSNLYRFEITTYLIQYVFWIFILVLAFNRWQKTKRKQPIQDRAVKPLLIALIVLECTRLIYWITLMLI